MIATIAVLAGLSGLWQAGEARQVGLTNLDFESGKEPWKAWYSDERNYQGPRFQYTIDQAAAHSGKASMRIGATSRDGRVFVHQSTDRFQAGARYELSYWVKFSRPEMAATCDVRINLRTPRAEGKGSSMRTATPILFGQQGDDGWIFRRGCFEIDKGVTSLQLGLYVRDTVGTAWFDDLQLREMPEGQVRVDSVYAYDPLQVKLGSHMVRRFNKLVEGNSPLLERAKVYNQLLVDAALLAEDARRLRRVHEYRRAAGATEAVPTELAAAAELEKALDGLYQTYGRLFVGRAEDLSPFDRAAAGLRGRIEQARREIAARRQAMQAAARGVGASWSVPPEPTPKPIVIEPDGRPNQLVIGTRSPSTHFALEEPLGINRLHSVSVSSSNSKEPGQYGFESALESWHKLRELGAECASVGTPLAVHDKQLAPTWFLKQYAADPDILMQTADGMALSPPRYGAALNIWRPEVRAMTTEAIGRLCETFRNEKAILWYVTAAENIGPYLSCQKGVRSTGYNRSALPDFHAWLRERYGRIEELNRQWKSDYKGFDQIGPPEDLCIAGQWLRPHPLGYEFQAWREDRHFRWQKFIYDSLKRADPSRAVFASPSSFLRSSDASQLFDTVDIMGFHTRAPHFMLGSIYIHSLNRFAGKQLGQYECFWGCQEDLPRIGEERVQRAAMMKYLYRLTVWGRHVQVWWYAYTSADYLLSYNGNWFNPVYDLTTLRYCAAALPVGKAKFKRLEEIFLRSTIVPSRVAMIQPNTSMLFQRYGQVQSFLEMLELHQMLFARNDLYELIPESYFLDGKARLADFDVLILPCAPYFPPGMDEKLDAWVRAGGVLVAAGPMGLFDRFGFDASRLWNAAFGKPPVLASQHGETDWQWRLEGSESNFVRTTLGKGQVLVSLRSLRNAEQRATVGPKLLAAIEAKAPPAASSPTEDLEMTIHRSADGRMCLCAMNRNVDRTVDTTVSLAGRYARGVDLDVPGGFPVPCTANGERTTFAIRPEPAEFTVIALEAAP